MHDQDKRPRTAAVCGGTGFIGSRLVQRLLGDGWQVRVLANRPPPRPFPENVQFYLQDFVDTEVPRAFFEGADVLFLVAGEVKVEARMHAVHVLGVRRLLDAAAGRVARWVHLSSAGVYGPRRDGVITEDTVFNPSGVYEETKAQSEQMVLAAANAGLEACALRPTIVFGEDMQNASLRALAGMIRRGLFFFVGRPGAAANYVHVDNVVEGLLRCANPNARGAYNLSNDMTIEDFVGIIARAVGRRPHFLRLPELPVRTLAWAGRLVPGFPLTPSRVDALTGRATYPTARLERETGYRHPATMDEALSRVVRAWFPG